MSTINESSIRIVFFDFLLIFCTILHASTTGIIPNFRTENPEFRIQNSEFRIQNSEFRIQNSEFRIQNSEPLQPGHCEQ
eukprot:COSAG02_NODE_7551_length_2965_cov_3.215980_6_plen_79_part_00